MQSHREFPKIYCDFAGKQIHSGSHKNFWIQDATEEWYPEIINNLTHRFIGDEPTTKYLKCQKDPESMRFFATFWADLLKQQYSIICLTRDAADNISLAGFNILVMSVQGEDKVEAKGETAKTLFRIMQFADSQCDFYKKFERTRYMGAFGLFVLPEFRGEGLGERILRTRELLCRNVGVDATVTAFTSIISQKLAARVGFQDLYNEEYQRLGEIDAQMRIDGITEHTKCFKNMYKLYK